MQIFRKLPTKQTKLVISNSMEVTPSNYQLDGTCTAIFRPWILAAMVTGQDPSGMGRWSFIKKEGKEAPGIGCATSKHDWSHLHSMTNKYGFSCTMDRLLPTHANNFLMILSYKSDIGINRRKQYSFSWMPMKMSSIPAPKALAEY